MLPADGQTPPNQGIGSWRVPPGLDSGRLLRISLTGT